MGPIDDELAAQLRRGFAGETLEFSGAQGEDLSLQHVQSAAQRSPGALLV